MGLLPSIPDDAPPSATLYRIFMRNESSGFILKTFSSSSVMKRKRSEALFSSRDELRRAKFRMVCSSVQNRKSIQFRGAKVGGANLRRNGECGRFGEFLPSKDSDGTTDITGNVMDCASNLELL